MFIFSILEWLLLYFCRDFFSICKTNSVVAKSWIGELNDFTHKTGIAHAVTIQVLHTGLPKCLSFGFMEPPLGPKESNAASVHMKTATTMPKGIVPLENELSIHFTFAVKKKYQLATLSETVLEEWTVWYLMTNSLGCPGRCDSKVFLPCKSIHYVQGTGQ